MQGPPGYPPAPPPPGGYGAPPGGYGAPPPQGYGYPGQLPPGAQQGGKSGFVTMMLAIAPACFGIFGIHRFYTGHVGIGIAQLLTFGGCGIWQLIDIISIATRKDTDSQGRQLLRDHPARQLM